MPIRLAHKAPEAYDYPLLIRHLLHTALATAPRQEIVYRDQVRYTYIDLHQRIHRLAAGLAKVGVREGQTVAILDWDSHRYLECYFAVPMMGAVLQTVNVRLAPEQILYTLTHSRAEVILAHRDFVPLLQQMSLQLGHVRAWVLIVDEDDGSNLPAGFASEYETLLAASKEGFEFHDFDENAVATTFYTTGTTGQPKAVCYSHRQIVLHALAGLGALASPSGGQSFRHGDVYLPLTPMFHAHAWGIPYIACLLGVKQVFPGRFDPEFVLRLKRNENVTFSHCVPSILSMLLNTSSAQRMDLKGWKLVLGGSALPLSLAKSALARGMDVWSGYGMSETGPMLVLSRLPSGSSIDGDDETHIRCKQGVPIPLVDLRIVDENMRSLPWDGVSVGEVVARAPWLTMAYAGDETASAALWRGGYLHTQDAASLDPAGYVVLCDRMKDIIKSGGEWVSSLLLEDLISRHPEVAEVAVVAIPDARWGERPMALVVPRLEFRTVLTAESIRAHMIQFVDSGRMKRHDIPDRIDFVESLARTSVGKIDKKLIREHIKSNLAAES